MIPDACPCGSDLIHCPTCRDPRCPTCDPIGSSGCDDPEMPAQLCAPHSSPERTARIEAFAARIGYRKRPRRSD